MSPDSTMIGTTISHYRILEKLGGGGAPDDGFTSAAASVMSTGV